MRWVDQVKAAIEAPLHECARKATVREEWRWIVKRATTPRCDHDQSVKTVTSKKKTAVRCRCEDNLWKFVDKDSTILKSVYLVQFEDLCITE
ncbi:jg972 [Pararge aegeria aegeria]|uniref:Jg972 protein n=1 Tax=Pararge aegeria aegeria TaxID=348720 RepID=A0A8S4S5H7_9NEOP|nr:jg972 [Pararge aegeria aegeria]